VCQRSEISGCADRAARRNVRKDTAVQALEQQLDRLHARSGVALRQGVCAQEHRGAHHRVRIRLAHAARVRPQQPQLQFLGQLLGDLLRDEAAEAGIHTVGVLVRTVRDPLDDLPGGAHLNSRTLGERRGRPPLDGHRPDVLE